MMSSGSPPMMPTMHGALWPFPYPLKPFELAIHPAFMQSPYRALPVQYSPQMVTRTIKSNSDNFTIDAILKRDKCGEILSDEEYGEKQLNKLVQEQNEISRRRHQRLFDAGHPYSHVTQEAKQDVHKHFNTSPSYKQYTDSHSDDGIERKSSGQSDEWKHTKGKRVRTIFTPEQLERLEAEFERQQYMVGTERFYLASSLNLTEAQVKVWFQNRRIKWRKQHLEEQQAKLKSLDLYKDIESASESEDGEEDPCRKGENSALSLHNPFQSPKEMRYTQ